MQGEFLIRTARLPWPRQLVGQTQPVSQSLSNTSLLQHGSGVPAPKLGGIGSRPRPPRSSAATARSLGSTVAAGGGSPSNRQWWPALANTPAWAAGPLPPDTVVSGRLGILTKIAPTICCRGAATGATWERPAGGWAMAPVILAVADQPRPRLPTDFCTGKLCRPMDAIASNEPCPFIDPQAILAQSIQLAGGLTGAVPLERSATTVKARRRRLKARAVGPVAAGRPGCG